MASRAAAHLPRILVLGLAFLLGGAALTYGAAKRLSAANSNKPLAPAMAPTVLVPDITGQAFTFAKGALEDAGFAWQVVGSVQGYASNRVVSQSPAAGTKLKDTGAPTVTVKLSRSAYPQTGVPEDVSPYIGTAIVPAARALAAPAALPPATQAKGAAQTPAAGPKPGATTALRPATTAAAKPAPTSSATSRPPAFAVAGAPKEPLKEIPLIDRAQRLSDWLTAHPKPTNATVRYFLFQNAWVVTGAKFGWWHGAEALKLLIAADQKAEGLWGIGHKSELAARHALADVESRSH